MGRSSRRSPRAAECSGHCPCRVQHGGRRNYTEPTRRSRPAAHENGAIHMSVGIHFDAVEEGGGKEEMLLPALLSPAPTLPPLPQVCPSSASLFSRHPPWKLHPTATSIFSFYHSKFWHRMRHPKPVLSNIQDFSRKNKRQIKPPRCLASNVFSPP